MHTLCNPFASQTHNTQIVKHIVIPTVPVLENRHSKVAMFTPDLTTREERRDLNYDIQECRSLTTIL